MVRAVKKECVVGYLIASAISLMAGGHWLFQQCYSRGYDYFLWLYNAWLVGEGVERGQWVNWSAYSAAGQPAFKMAGLTDALFLSIFIDTFGIDGGTRIYACLLYVIAGTGIYALGYWLTKSSLGAVVASAAYVFSWFLTFTVYYQTYLSNFLLFALMPWGGMWFSRAVVDHSRGWLLAAIAVVFSAITTNAQVAIKLLLFIVPFAYVDAVYSRGISWKRWGQYSAYLGLFSVWLAFFLIVPALNLRGEIVLLGDLRGNAFVAPWLTVLSIPLFGLNYLSYQLFGASWLDREFFVWAIYSDYVGISVLAIACCAAPLVRGSRAVRGLVFLFAGYAALYFVAVPNMAASAWVGRTHNWAILTTISLALLCAYGAMFLARQWSSRTLWQWGAVLCGIIFVDLGGTSYFLNKLAITHTPLRELPEVRTWRELAARDKNWSEDGRFFTFNPDHTFYLLPVFHKKQVANIIELRGRNWEYDSYLAHQMQAMSRVDSSYRASEALAILNVDYVDLARKLYVQQGKEERFALGRSLLHNDSGLEPVLSRSMEKEDWSYNLNRRDLDIAHVVNSTIDQEVLSQVIYRNKRKLWAYLPEQSVLIWGDTRKGEKAFEAITQIEGYRADRLLFVLADEHTEIAPAVLEQFIACVPVGDSDPPAGLPVWQESNLVSFYRGQPQQRGEGITRGVTTSEFLEIKVAPSANDRLLFLSRQYFSDWHAYGDSGEELPVLKASAGLTALFLPRGTKRVEFRYELPQVEQLARYFSLLGVLVALVWWRVGVGRVRRIAVGDASRGPLVKVAKNSGEKARHGMPMSI